MRNSSPARRRVHASNSVNSLPSSPYSHHSQSQSYRSSPSSPVHHHHHHRNSYAPPPPPSAHSITSPVRRASFPSNPPSASLSSFSSSPPSAHPNARRSLFTYPQSPPRIPASHSSSPSSSPVHSQIRDSIEISGKRTNRTAEEIEKREKEMAKMMQEVNERRREVQEKEEEMERKEIELRRVEDVLRDSLKWEDGWKMKDKNVSTRSPSTKKNRKSVDGRKTQTNRTPEESNESEVESGIRSEELEELEKDINLSKNFIKTRLATNSFGKLSTSSPTLIPPLTKEQNNINHYPNDPQTPVPRSNIYSSPPRTHEASFASSTNSNDYHNNNNSVNLLEKIKDSLGTMLQEREVANREREFEARERELRRKELEVCQFVKIILCKLFMDLGGTKRTRDR